MAASWDAKGGQGGWGGSVGWAGGPGGQSARGSGGSVGSGGHMDARATARSSRLVFARREVDCRGRTVGEGAWGAGKELGEEVG